MKQIKSQRQGDVLLKLEKINLIQKNAVLVETEKNRVVLMYGEVTGHAHAIYNDIDKVKVWAIGKVKYLEVMAEVMLKHEEHTEHIIDAGIYKLPVQTEYTPKELRQTRD